MEMSADAFEQLVTDELDLLPDEMVDGHLHYRSVDVSSIKELCRRWFPRVYFNAPEKHGGHRALADILESIRELEYYRRAGFVAEPGPSTDDVRAVQADVVAKWESRLAQPAAE